MSFYKAGYLINFEQSFNQNMMHQIAVQILNLIDCCAKINIRNVYLNRYLSSCIEITQSIHKTINS